MEMRTRLRLLVHERDGHDDVVGYREADLQVGTESELHAKEDVAEDCQEFGVCSGL